MSWQTHESMNQLDHTNSTLAELISSTFSGATITHIADAGQGRGVFSLVSRVHLAGAPVPSVVVKAPAAGANGEAARRTGSYSREAFAYRHILRDLAVRSPDCYAVLDIEGDPWFVLEDLCDMRHFDQLGGLEIEDCLDLTRSLATLHETHLSNALVSKMTVRGPSDFDPAQLQAGFAEVARRFGTRPDIISAFERLLNNRKDLVDQFAAAGQNTFCHGDPRADNAVASNTGPILLDWQQITMAFGESDLAWLLATSVTKTSRAEFETPAIEHYAKLRGSSVGETWDRYRLGLVRPGLAVLLLATRESTDSRISALISQSLERIAEAITAHGVGDV